MESKKVETATDVDFSAILGRLYLAIAAILGGLSVAAGAFAAHVFQGALTEKSLSLLQTAARYQMYHALALLAIALLLLNTKRTASWLGASGAAMIFGIFSFSGSLYALSLSGVSWLGAITPIGGLGLLIGWFLLAIAAFREAL